jgi:HEAT repeat protein
MNRFDKYNRLLHGETVGWINGRRIIKEPTSDEYDLLLSLLSHEKTRLRWQAADKLGKIGDDRAAEPLVNTLMDVNWLVRLHAVKALGRIGSPTIIEPLISMMKDECPYVRRSTIRALRIEQSVKDPRVTAILLSALGDTDKVVRAHSVWTLGYVASPIVVRAIADAVSDRDNNVSWRAIDALQRIGSPGIEVLINLLGSSDGEIRYRSVKALGKIGDARATDAIEGVLNDPNEKVRRRAELALRGMRYRKQGLGQWLMRFKNIC